MRTIKHELKMSSERVMLLPMSADLVDDIASVLSLHAKHASPNTRKMLVAVADLMLDQENFSMPAFLSNAKPLCERRNWTSADEDGMHALAVELASLLARSRNRKLCTCDGGCGWCLILLRVTAMIASLLATVR